jgi:glycine dehydrogenase subunit 1
MTIRVSMLGKQGFRQVAQDCLAKAHYLHDQVVALSGYADAFQPAPYFNEFAVRVRGGSAGAVCRALESKGIIAGYDLGRARADLSNALLVAVTEKHTRADLDALVAALDGI